MQKFKMQKNKIYVLLQGRIGNQLFQYALARKLQLELGEETEIVMDDSEIIRCGWETTIKHYALPNVSYVHSNIMNMQPKFSKPYLLRKIYRLCTRSKDYNKKYETEKRLNGFFNKNGMFFCENGYIEPKITLENPIYLEGFFQTEKYFADIRDDILRLLDGSQFQKLSEYPGLDKLKNSNSVCISVKVEHNVGSSIYDVCSMEYWKKAIDYITKTVENPLFFICSDNVPYVLEHLIDTEKFDYVVQNGEMPVHLSLAAMAACKHFIIGNTTFGWWAQYLSKEKGIVVAPSKWMKTEMPIDIYQDGWHLIEV